MLRAGTGRAKKKCGPPPSESDSHARDLAVAKWAIVLNHLAQTGVLRLPPGESAEQVAREALEPRATSTLAKRAGSILRFIGWAGVHDVVAFPVDAGVARRYLREAAEQAASRGESFLEAMAFLGHFFHVDVEEVLTPRCRGLAFRGLKRKRDTRKARPFPRKILAMFEEKVVHARKEEVTGEELTRAVLVGFFTWLAHSRTRCGDSTSVTSEPTLDVDEAGHGFINGRLVWPA